jgi:4-diphosphocytidyl-2-C-methyl-D-erythritol kinase
VTVRAPAKVNLTLRILERRPSGFHDLETLFQAVALHDDLVVRRRPEQGVALRVRGADVGPPADNLVTRAATAFLEAAGGNGSVDLEGVEIELVKRIPAGAGLGGGSSDAGATLRALAALFPGLVPTARLRSLAADLGSDVPFFTGTAGLALGRGRGERLTPLAPLPPAPVLLALPPVHVATGGAYAALARFRAEAGGETPKPHFADDGTDVPRSWAEVAARAVNDFEPVIAPAHPEVARAGAALRATGPLFSLLSGSGAALFAVYADDAAAEAARIAAEAACPGVAFLVTRTLERLPALNESAFPA